MNNALQLTAYDYDTEQQETIIQTESERKEPNTTIGDHVQSIRMDRCYHHHVSLHGQQYGGLHKKIKNSKIAKHTSEYLQRKLANMTLKHVKDSNSPADDLPPIIVHFNHSSISTMPSRDSESIMSSSSAATTSTWRATLGPEDNELVSSLSAKQIKYQELLHEFIMTEEVYLTDLQLVQQVFITDLESTWENLPEPVQRTFDSLRSIIEFHVAVLADLRDCQNAQPPLIVGDVVERFRNYIPHIFNVYKEYFAHFEPANDLIAKSLSDPQTAALKILGSYVQERCLYPECRSLTLQSFLLKPVQRLMKYPLFLKSQIECFEENDEAIQQHIQCMSEMDATIRSIEEYKNQTEQASRLNDLSERIRNLQELGIQLNLPHRRLVHEGPLVLIPLSSESGSSGSFAPPQRSFSESSRHFFTKQKKQPLYVFLFNDLILFTKIRTKRISQAENELRANSSGGQNLYGPAPDLLFKLVASPGQITHLERVVLQRGPPTLINNNTSTATTASINRSAWFGSFCRSGSSSTKGDKSKGTGSMLSSRSYHQHQQNSEDLNVNPFQFMCSIASKNISNMLLEAKTVEEKQIWCDCIESVRGEHCQRGNVGENSSSSSNKQEQHQSLATEETTLSDNSNGIKDPSLSSFNTSWFSENSLRNIMAKRLDENGDNDDDDSSDEISSIYSSIWDEGVTKSFQSSIFSTEPFNIENQQSKLNC
ncbi:Dbl homology domain-containing protein [Circinella umbellata]|nr:Dbl homology domain-containing protein [Circinella umbellata]